MADSQSRLPKNGTQKTSHEYNYITETIQEIYEVKDLSEGRFTVKF